MAEHNTSDQTQTKGSIVFCKKVEEAFFYLFYAFAILAGVNWGLYGFAQVDLIQVITNRNKVASRVIYAIIGVFTLVLLGLTVAYAVRSKCSKRNDDKK